MTTFPRSDSAKGTVLVLGNGNFPSRKRLAPWIKKSGLIVCCDGAADKALAYGIVPDVAIGDLDSISPRARKKARKIVRVPDQDSTDLEKALAWCGRNAADKKQVVLAGFTGGRTDFTLYNLFLLKKFADRDPVMIDDSFTVFPARSGTPLSGLVKGTRISLMALERTVAVTTSGLKWNLRNGTLEPGRLQSVSNRVTSPVVTVVFKKGFLLWFIGTRDADRW